MSRHLWNLEILFGKLQARLGDNNAVTVQVKREMEACQAIETKYQAKFPIRTERFLRRAAERHRNVASNHLH